MWIHSARWLDLAERDSLRVIVRGEGSRLFDVKGKSYIDGLAGLYVVNVGHGRAEIAEAMGISRGGVSSTLRAAHSSLRRQLVDLSDHPGRKGAIR